MAGATAASGWTLDTTSTLGSQVAAESNPNVSTDSGQSTRSSPYLAAAAPSSLATVTAKTTWGQTATTIASSDAQAVSDQRYALSVKQAKDSFTAQENTLNKQIKAAEAAGQAQAKKAAASAAALEKKINQQVQQGIAVSNAERAKLKQMGIDLASLVGGANSSYDKYNSSGGSSYIGGSGAGVSSAGQSQLAIARADGYNLGAGNYNRTYHNDPNLSAERNDVMGQAYNALGTHYVLGGEKNQVAMDCSGLVQMIYSQFGYNIPFHSAAHESGVVGNVAIPGVRTNFNNLQPGDLVCWKSGDHIAIYAGNGEIIEAANTRVGTVRRPMWDSTANVFGIHLTLPDERAGSGHNGASGQGRR